MISAELSYLGGDSVRKKLLHFQLAFAPHLCCSCQHN